MGCGNSSVAAPHVDSNGNVENGKGHTAGQRNAGGVARQNQPDGQDESSESNAKSVEQPAEACRQSHQKEPDLVQQEVEPVHEQDKSAKPADQEPDDATQEQDKPGKDSVQGHADPASKLAESVQKQAEPVEETVEQLTTNSAPAYTEETLKELLALQQKLSVLDSKNIVGEYQTQHAWLVSRYENLQAAQKKAQQLKQQTEKEYQDVAYMQHPTVRAMFSNVHQLQTQMAKEQQEYMEALNRQEVAEKELKLMQQEYNTLYAVVDTLRNEYDELVKVRDQQQNMLDEIFGGAYGSELEEQLEKETDLLNERKEMVTATRNRWYNAKVLMKHAFDQLGYSTRRWAQINTVQPELVQWMKKTLLMRDVIEFMDSLDQYFDSIQQRLEDENNSIPLEYWSGARYSMVAETRNYLIAASQNITNSHRCLGNVDIPYCNSEDLKILNNAISSLFNDIMTRKSYSYALQTYNTLHNKAGTLLQWIDMVLEKTINKDLEEIVPQCHTKLLELRRERLRLIQVKTRELQGNDDTEDVPEVEVAQEPEPVPGPKSNTRIAEPDTVSLKEEEGKKDDVAPPPNVETNEMLRESEISVANTEESGIVEGATAKPKPLTELAPVPTQDALFGNIEELKTKYEDQVAEFSRAQDVNKARVDQSLQDKLRARRHRRKRVELQQLETSELAKGVTRAEKTK